MIGSRLQFSGNLGIGTTNPLRKLEINNAMRFTNSSADTNDGVLGTAIFAAGLNIVGIDTDGGGRKINYWGLLIQNSSRDYKKDIETLTSSDYQDILKRLSETEIFRFRYKEANEDSRLILGLKRGRFYFLVRFLSFLTSIVVGEKKVRLFSQLGRDI